MTPLISILMPVHNGAAFLGEAIRSMLSQTLGDFEFLIVDDASTDTSASIVQDFKDPRIRLIRSAERLKLSG
ncbi:MAG: glycosyltransferase family 2 protein, partial [bacterium]